MWPPARRLSTLLLPSLPLMPSSTPASQGSAPNQYGSSYHIGVGVIGAVDVASGRSSAGGDWSGGSKYSNSPTAGGAAPLLKPAATGGAVGARNTGSGSPELCGADVSAAGGTNW